ncbi:hypothetical protein NC652_035553 [Populus alba x Populus x berolinensis]|nr:hypothetical protein NC652_035553 [Populus alba x Populus x berolinensis]
MEEGMEISSSTQAAESSSSDIVSRARKLLFRRMLVGIKDGRFFLGSFHCIDKQGNIILQDAVEYRNTHRSSPSPMEQRCLGLILIPSSCRTSCHIEFGDRGLESRKLNMNQKPRKVMSKFLSIIEEGERYGQEEEWIRFLEPNGPSIRKRHRELPLLFLNVNEGVALLLKCFHIRGAAFFRHILVNTCDLKEITSQLTYRAKFNEFMGVDEGRQVHRLIVKMDFVCDIYVENSLVHFYSVCGSLDDASRVFDEMLVRDAVSWTGVISGNVSAGLFDKAVGKGNLSLGKGIRGLIIERGFGLAGWQCSHGYVCEVIICGMVQCKFPKEALELSCDVQSSGIEPDGIILTSVLSACASLGALDYGRWVHESIDHKVIKWDIQIGTAMVDMYAKCGCIEMAMQIFNGMPHKNALTWNAMLNGLAMHGHGQKALQLFEEMVREGMRPNDGDISCNFDSLLPLWLGYVDDNMSNYGYGSSKFYSRRLRISVFSNDCTRYRVANLLE